MYSAATVYNLRWRHPSPLALAVSFQLALQYYAELDAAGGADLHTSWTRGQRDVLLKRHPRHADGRTAHADALRRRVANVTLCESSPLYSRPLHRAWSDAVLLLRAGFLREGHWFALHAVREASAEEEQALAKATSAAAESAVRLIFVLSVDNNFFLCRWALAAHLEYHANAMTCGVCRASCCDRPLVVPSLCLCVYACACVCLCVCLCVCTRARACVCIWCGVHNRRLSTQEPWQTRERPSS